MKLHLKSFVVSLHTNDEIYSTLKILCQMFIFQCKKFRIIPKTNTPFMVISLQDFVKKKIIKKNIKLFPIVPLTHSHYNNQS